MVGPDRVVNAVSLNSVIVHTARIAGPALAGVVIALWGVGPCFLVNAALVRRDDRRAARDGPGRARSAAPVVPREPGALRAALRYVRATPALRVPLAMMALVGTLSFNFQVMLPLLARFSFDGRPPAYAALMTAMGVGSVLGRARRRRARAREPGCSWSRPRPSACSSCCWRVAPDARAGGRRRSCRSAPPA